VSFKSGGAYKSERGAFFCFFVFKGGCQKWLKSPFLLDLEAVVGTIMDKVD